MMKSSEKWLTNLFEERKIEKSFCTKAGWNLYNGMLHMLEVHDGIFRPIIMQQMIPSIFYSDSSKEKKSELVKEEILQWKSPKNCFQSLCRIISGQQLAGAAAQKIWLNLLEATKNDLTPVKILKFVSDGNLETHLRKPAGISHAKARSIIALSEAFKDGTLSESFLTTGDVNQVREKLLQVKGIGPWSVDMFFIFYLEKPDVFPIGDLAVRKAIADLFGLKGKGQNGSLDMKKDAEKMHQIMSPCKPFQSLATFYLYKVLDEKVKKEKLKKMKSEKNTTTSPPRKRRRIVRQVTP